VKSLSCMLTIFIGSPRIVCSMSSVDGCNFKKKQNNLQDAEDNRTPGYSHHVDSMENTVPDQDVDDYLVPIEYEYVSSNTGDYCQLDAMTVGVPQHHDYTTLNILMY